MPKNALKQTFEMPTRNSFTKVDCEIGITVEGRELPNLAVLGEALEQAISLITNLVAESYKAVPERV